MVGGEGDRATVSEVFGPAGLESNGMVIYERLLPAVAESVPRIRGELAAVLVFSALDVRRRSDIALFVTEAASNAVRHAYAGDPGPLYAAAGVDDESLRVVISDWGRWLQAGAPEPTASAKVTKHAGAGLGRGLMSRLADAVSIDSDESGTDVEGSFALTGAAGHPCPSVDVRGGQMLREYLRVLRQRNDEPREDNAAVMGEARQAVAHSRRRRLARHQLH